MNKILFVGQLPPPLHGQAVVNKLVFDADFEGIESLCLPMNYSKNIDQVGSASFGKLLELVKLIVKTWKIYLIERPDVIYYPPASAHKVPVIRDILYLGMTRFLFKKTIFHFHAGGLEQYLDSIGLLGKLAKHVYRKPDLAIELYKEEDSPGAYFSAQRVEIIPNGLDVVYNKQKSLVKRESFKILFVGSLRESKGVLDALRIIASLVDKGLSVQMSFAGSWVSDSFKKEALELVDQFNLNDHVSWLGVLEGQRKWQAFQNADCFLFPTFYESEKFPLVLIEALGMGLPVMSTNWRGIPQLLEGSGDAAAIVDPKDINHFAQVIKTLIEDKEYYERACIDARAHYKNNYTQERFIESMQATLSKV